MNARSTELVTAVGTARTFEPRLTGGFAYAPVRGPVRGSNDAASLSPDVRIAIAEIEKQYAAKPIAATAAHCRAATRTARSAFSKQPRSSNPTDAKILSDLSAAYLVRAERNDDSHDRCLARPGDRESRPRDRSADAGSAVQPRAGAADVWA